MTNTRYGKIRTNTITTPYPHSITINTRTVHAIKSNSDINTSPNYSVYRGVLPKTKCKSLFSRHFMFTLIVILASFTFTDMVNAGTCWAKRTQSGKCMHPMERNISREKCCGGGDDVGFTEKEMTEFEYFFATALGDGTPCSSCIDSCKTAKCGGQKKCVMRGGQPKCVCAPNCKTKNQRPKRSDVNHPAQSKVESNDHELKQQKQQNRPVKSGENSHIDDKENTSHGDVQIDPTNNNQSHKKSDKIVSIIAPIHHPSNLSSSYRPKKNQNFAQLHGGDGSRRQNNAKSNYHNNKTHRHKLSTHTNEYNNSSLTDNNIVNVNHRRQTSMEQQFKSKSKFYGHDIPYPPVDLPLYDNHQFHRAVCGTDGKTYKSECQLRRRACRQDTTSLSIAYKGQCQTSCKHVQCPLGQHCLEDQNLMPHCVTCSITCPPYDPAVKSVIQNPARLVCGIDGHTYRNLCEIKRTACMLGRSIAVAYRGACKEGANCDTVRCKDRQVCLSDLVTHRPRCVSCSFKCPRRKRPQGQQSAFIKICGMNNKSYHSWCHMMRDSCNTGYYIDVKHNGVCHNSTKT